ncbi:MAG: CFI-box-CTERM domain-containing protein [Lachnospiraceae bacterium]|nr:CFI-box-CTERM domain-containing protein [Lachnospiraceae bacterium]
MITNHEEKLLRLFNTAEELMPFFKRNDYEKAFNDYSNTNKDIFDEINSELEGKDEEIVNTYVAELAVLFVSLFKKEYDELSKKGKKSAYVTNHNTPLVIYVFPAILNYSAKWCKPCVEALVAKWNETFTETNISYGTYSDIKGGFKTKLCYITTAVCESLNKSDDCLELNLLRNYRDNILACEEGGSEIISEYYNIAPTIVKRINRSDNPSEVYASLYKDYILGCIKDIENENYEECKETYTSMVNELKNKYAY